MSEFEKWFRSLNANGKTVYFLGNEHKVSEMAWNHKQAEVDELQLKNAELARITLDKNRDIVKQAMQIDELQKQVDDCAALAKEWRTLAREMCPLDDKYVIGARLGCAQDIEEVLRGAND